MRGPAMVIHEGDAEVASHFARLGIVAEPAPARAQACAGVRVELAAPTAARPFYTVFTAGLHREPRAPRSVRGPSRAELMLCLPPDWMTQGADSSWPLELLGAIGRSVTEGALAIADGTIVARAESAGGYARSTALCSALLTPPKTLPEAAAQLESAWGRIQIHAVVPLYDAERQLAVEEGVATLRARLERFCVTEIVNAERAPVTPRRVLSNA